MTTCQKMVRFFDGGWTGIWLSMLLCAAAMIRLLTVIPHQSLLMRTTSWVFVVYCVGLLICFGGAILTVVANECRHMPDSKMRLASLGLLAISQVAWITGICIIGFAIYLTQA